MPEPLKRKKKDGTQYERPPEIEAFLEKLEIVESSERLRQFETLSKTKPGYVPSEVLVYFLRRAGIEGAKTDFEKIFRINVAASSGFNVLNTVGATTKLKKMMLPTHTASVTK